MDGTVPGETADFECFCGGGTSPLLPAGQSSPWRWAWGGFQLCFGLWNVWNIHHLSIALAKDSNFLYSKYKLKISCPLSLLHFEFKCSFNFAIHLIHHSGNEFIDISTLKGHAGLSEQNLVRFMNAFVKELDTWISSEHFCSINSFCGQLDIWVTNLPLSSSQYFHLNPTPSISFWKDAFGLVCVWSAVWKAFWAKNACENQLQDWESWDCLNWSLFSPFLVGCRFCGSVFCDGQDDVKHEEQHAGNAQEICEFFWK